MTTLVPTENTQDRLQYLQWIPWLSIWRPIHFYDFLCNLWVVSLLILWNACLVICQAMYYIKCVEDLTVTMSSDSKKKAIGLRLSRLQAVCVWSPKLTLISPDPYHRESSNFDNNYHLMSVWIIIHKSQSVLWYHCSQMRLCFLHLTRVQRSTKHDWQCQYGLSDHAAPVAQPDWYCPAFPLLSGLY